MPGAWEYQSSVLVYVLYAGYTTMAWSLGLRNLIIPGNHPILPVTGVPYDHGRNIGAKACLDGGFEWLFSLDFDVIPPRDAIIRLMSHRQPFISGLYSRRSPPHSVPVMIRNGTWITDYNPGSIVEVDLVGAGCLLTHRSVVEDFFRRPQRPGKPMFDWKVDLQGLAPPGECLSEDFTTCLEYRKRGGHVLVDTGCKCKHVGDAEFDHGNVQPLNTVSVT